MDESGTGSLKAWEASERGSLKASARGPSYDTAERSNHVATGEGNSAILTAGIIVADVVGAGILSMAVAVSKFGWLLGTILTVLLLSMNVHIAIMMWRVHRKCPEARTFVQLVASAFGRAPTAQHQAAVRITGLIQYLFLFCLLGLYSLSFGKGFAMMFYDVRLCLRTWTLIGCAVLLPFQARARTLGKWPLLIWLNVATILGSILIPLVWMASAGGLDNTRPEGSVIYAVAPLTLSNALTGISLMSFAFTSQFMIVEIISEMKDPAEFPRAYITLSAPFQCISFLVVGIAGYYFVGDSVTGMIGDNIKYGIWFRLAALCLCCHMLITFMIKGVVLCNAVFRACSLGLSDESLGGWSLWTLVVLVVVSVSWLFAQVVPFFSDLVDLLGASFTPVGCYMIPILFYLRWHMDFGEKDDSISFVERVVIVIEFALAALLTVAGTYFALVHIHENWNTYGFPFACHCEHIWNTCACSASHAGMEEQCPANSGTG
mmetsp:Transcript_130668/g.279392  ORF Transcript_130668/g.279392 Transcript_130668/m.279392 type:complete len:490 (+) Transcript_130668:77-1546(+)